MATGWGVASAALLLTVALYWSVVGWLLQTWGSNQDYSHGYFIPLFTGYLLWSGRASLAQRMEHPGWIGVALTVLLFASALGLRIVGNWLRVPTLEALSLLPYLLGLLVALLGGRAFLWGLPAVLYLLFMLPLPSSMSGSLSGVLQSIATSVSTFTIQTLGIPAFAEGNIIHLTNGEIGVAEACSGIRMLYTFFALTVGACMLIDRTPIEKFLIGLSAVPIAILVNCIRITATGLAFEYFSPEAAQHVFHDLAGWLMMPLGLIILMLGLALLDKLILPTEAAPS